MRKRLLLVLFLASGAAHVGSQAPEPNRVAYWPDAELKSVDTNNLSAKAKKGTAGAEFFLTTAHHQVLMARRERPGPPELHKAEIDIMIVRTGGGILQVGGEIVDRKDSAAGATGSSIRGGDRHTLGPGDVINIPANVPHAWLLGPGEQVTYFLVKVKEPIPSAR